MSILEAHSAQVDLANIDLYDKFKCCVKKGNWLFFHVKARIAVSVKGGHIEALFVWTWLFYVIRLNISLYLLINMQLLVNNVRSQLTEHILERYIFLEGRLYVQFEERFADSDPRQIQRLQMRIECQLFRQRYQTALIVELF